MDDQEFQRLLQNVAPPAQPQAQPQPGLTVDTEALASMAHKVLSPTQLDAQGRRPDGTSYSEPPSAEQPLGDPSSTDAVAGGILKGVFETKDFLFGDTAPEDRSEFRASVEDITTQRRQESMVDGFSSGIAQFAIGMIGLGKAKWAAQALPWLGTGLKALEAGKRGKVAVQSGQAALAGAIAFDPWEERLSNLIQSTPVANPLNAWLAADPEDSAAEGRMKAALESIGLDAAIGTVFMGATGIWKALRKGDTAAAERLAQSLDDEIKGAGAVDAEANAGVVPQEGGEPLPGTPEVTAAEGTPSAAPLDAPGGGAGSPLRQIAQDTPEQLLDIRPKPKAPQTDNYLRSLGGDAQVLYRETNEDGAYALLSNQTGMGPSGGAESFWSNARELATGQGDNKGFLLIADPSNLQGKTHTGKPGLAVADGQEFVVKGGKADDIVAIFTDQDLGSLKTGHLRNLIEQNFEAKPVEGGTLYVRKASPKAAEELPTATGEVPVQVTSTPTEAAQAADAKLTPSSPRIKLSDEDTAKVLEGMEADAAAISQHGGWYQAIEAGHTFGKGEGIPYVKLNADAEVDDFMARVVDAVKERLDNLKGGDVLTDKRVDKLVAQRAALFGEDPALLIGIIQQAGKDAAHAVPEMEAGYLVSARMLQDSYTLAVRISMGDFVEFGSKAAAMDALKHRLSLAASVYGSARSITAASARAMRRMRGEFKLDPETVAGLKGMDGEQLVELLVSTQGNPRNIARLANPTLWNKALDFGQFLLINNLVSGPKTHLVNLLSNAYMLVGRPLERGIGGAVQAAKGDWQGGSAIVRESMKQYAYMGTVLGDSFSLAAKAFLLNDSVLTPHRSEMWKGAATKAPNTALPGAWKPWTSVPNILHNGLKVATNTVGVPTRVLGTSDELMKQTVYRSKVLARAHMQAVDEAAKSGLKGKAARKFIKQFVQDKVDAAFDAQGRGVDPEALREANIATHQQELLPNTIGKTVQNAVTNHPGLRFVLPFVKTPTNILRYGWKMSPLLNLGQREYRDMWTGRMGKEAQAQAYGQMAMGTLFMGYAAYLVSQGSITGGGPSDPKLASELRTTGWQPYSKVIQNEDGTKTYVPFNRYDPVAMPLGIIADLQDAIHAIGEDVSEEELGASQIGAAMGALAIGLAKQFTSKTYLVGISAALDAMSDPDPNMATWGGQMLANFIPYSAAQRQLNPDPYLREARDVVDKALATVPGLSQKVPARYDAWGDPVLARRGLWSSDEDSVVDHEVQRLALEGGSSITRPQPVHNGVDLRDLQMSDGRNAYEVYQQLSGKPHPKATPLKKRVARLMETERYRRAPDGDSFTKGTKLWLLTDLTSKYRSAALKRLKRDKMVQEAFLKETKRVRQEYVTSRPTLPAKPRPSLGSVGDAFGVDLDALMAAPQ